MLMVAERSLLLIIDLQEKLLPVIHNGDQVVSESVWLAGVADELDVPVLVSEQYPQGLGATTAELTERLKQPTLIEKLHFSCMGDESCRQAIESADRDQIIIAGIESHVCVLQTTLNLLEEGFEVFVVSGAISSRGPEDVTLALNRMGSAGAQIVSREMVAFEWLGQSGTEQFKSISKNYLR